MTTRLEPLECAALEYLVSTACNFLVEMREERPGEFSFVTVEGDDAKKVGDFDLGQRFSSMYRPQRFPSPFEAAVMFVNAFRIWDQRMRETEEGDKEKLH